MLGTIRTMLASVVALLLAVGPAYAGELPHLPAEKILAPTPGNKACWQRVYDAAHLRRHPEQKIKSVTFFLRFRGYDAQGNPVTANPHHVTYDFAIAMQRRQDRRQLRTGGACLGNEGDPVDCAVECDAGGVTIDKAADGKGLLVRIHEGGIAFGNDCDANAGLTILPGADDKVFQLAPAGAAVCDRLEKSVLAE